MLDLTLQGRQLGHRPQLRLGIVESGVVKAEPIDGASVQLPRGARDILVVYSQNVRALFPHALGGVTQRLGNNVITQRGQGGLRRLGFAPDGIDQLRCPTSSAS
jgi:hypothetical protein